MNSLKYSGHKNFYCESEEKQRLLGSYLVKHFTSLLILELGEEYCRMTMKKTISIATQGERACVLLVEP